MSKKEKLLKKARENPADLRFEEFETLLTRCNWVKKRTSGSHRLWMSCRGKMLPVQPKGDKAKGYQVKQFLNIYDKEQI